jgi:hypothetical protein
MLIVGGCGVSWAETAIAASTSARNVSAVELRTTKSTILLPTCAVIDGERSKGAFSSLESECEIPSARSSENWVFLVSDYAGAVDLTSVLSHNLIWPSLLYLGQRNDQASDGCVGGILNKDTQCGRTGLRLHRLVEGDTRFQNGWILFLRES